MEKKTIFVTHNAVTEGSEIMIAIRPTVDQEKAKDACELIGTLMKEKLGEFEEGNKLTDTYAKNIADYAGPVMHRDEDR